MAVIAAAADRHSARTAVGAVRNHVELFADIDAKLLLDLVRRHLVLVRDERVELDTVLVVHLDTVRVLELQAVGNVAHGHQTGNDLLVHHVLDIPAVNLDAVPENILVGFRGTHVRLHAARHRLASQHEVRDLLVDELDKSRVDLLRVGHGEGLDVHLVLDARNDHLVLRGVGDLVGQALAVRVALRTVLPCMMGCPYVCEKLT